MKKINLGCGKDIKPKEEGWINVDSIKLKGVDVIHDLNKYLWPFKSGSIDYVYADNILEHLNDIISPLEEIYRILKNKGKAKILVPVWFGNGVFKDPTHKVVYTNRTFNYFSKNSSWNYYTKARYKINKKKIIFNRYMKFMEMINKSSSLEKFYFYFLSFIIKPSYMEVEIEK